MISAIKRVEKGFGFKIRGCIISGIESPLTNSIKLIAGQGFHQSPSHDVSASIIKQENTGDNSDQHTLDEHTNPACREMVQRSTKVIRDRSFITSQGGAVVLEGGGGGVQF